MLTNDLKSGMKIRLKNGYYAEIRDNKKGNARFCLVHGLYEELGSVYAWDIAFYVPKEGTLKGIVLTDKQIRQRNIVQAMGF